MNIVVLCGGLSPERNVSVSTGRRVAAALKSLGHRAVLLDMYFGLEGYSGSLEEAFDLPLPEGDASIAETEPDLDAVRDARELRSGSMFGDRVLDICAAAEIVFLALHGRCGEDGRVQAAFDLLGIRYTGSGYLGSALAMDKRLTKQIASGLGVLTPEWRFYSREELGGAEDIAGRTPLPCVVKPVNSGSSIGVEIVRTPCELGAALSRAALPLFVPMGIADWRLAYAMISGFAAKENIAATISMLMPEGTGLGMAAGLAAAAFVLACPACISAFSAACKEVGFKYAAKIFALQLAFAFACGYVVRFVAGIFD